MIDTEKLAELIKVVRDKRSIYWKRDLLPLEIKRIYERLLHLEEAKDKLAARLKATPILQAQSGKTRKTREKLAQIGTSIQNFEQHGFERPPDGRPVGASIGIP